MSPRQSRHASVALALCAAAIVALCSPARAETPDEGDGIHGRFDGDVVLSAAVGTGAAFFGDGAWVGTLELRARYLDSAGVFVAPEVRLFADPRILVGVDFRPLFLARFFRGLSAMHAWWDLVLDSLGVDLGVVLIPIGDHTGAGLALGGGIDLPIAVDRGVGLFMRLGARWAHALLEDRNGPPESVSDLSVFVALGWRLAADAGIAADEPPRWRAN